MSRRIRRDIGEDWRFGWGFGKRGLVTISECMRTGVWYRAMRLVTSRYGQHKLNECAHVSMLS